MKIIDFREMYQTYYHLRNLYVMNQKWWTDGYVFEMRQPRRTSALFFLANCSATYEFPDGSVQHFSCGSLLYLPQGSRYKTTFRDCVPDTVLSQLLEFELITEKDEVFAASDRVLLLRNFESPKCAAAFNELVSIYTSPVPSYALLQSSVYRLLNEICYAFHTQHIFSKKYSPIAQGILYLEQTIQNELNIPQVAAMCHMSETCFRRLFQQYSGFSPKEYQTKKRMEQAKNMLQSGSSSVTDIAYALGFEDPAYFSRVFKKNTGLSPSEYLQKNIKR